MAGNSVIGSLRVSLGIDSAQFEAGLKNAQSGLKNFSKNAGVALTAVGVAAAAAGAALGVMVKGAIDSADAMSKSAQKAGVTTEALSRLAYAAGYSDVSLEELTGSLAKLSKAMGDAVISKTSTSARAFKALGIEITDANGRLRNSDVVFAEIADRFATMENGATKTALAMQVFGKSGAALIPLLNGGGDEMRRLADEADRLGITLSTQTGKAAEKFNDTLTLIGKVLQGVVNQVAQAVLPSLQSLADTLASPEFAQAAQTLSTTLVGAFNVVVQAVVGTTNAIKGLLDWLNGLDASSAPLLNSLLPGEKLNLADRLREASAHPEGIGDLYAEFGLNPDGTLKIVPPKPEAGPFAPIFETDEPAAKLKKLDDGLNKFTGDLDFLGQTAQTVTEGLASGFSSIALSIVHGENALGALGNAFSNLGDQLIQMATNKLITDFLGTIFGSLGGTGLGTGSIGRGTYGGSGGFFPAFKGYAEGTSFHPGGLALVGEQGPEIVDLPRGSAVYPSGQGPGGTIVNIKVDARGAQAGVAEQIEFWARQKLPALINRTVKDPYAVGG